MDQISFFQPIRREVECFWPKTLSEALGLLTDCGEKGKIIAGGTDLALDLKMRKYQPDCLIYLGGVSELDFVRRESKVIRIGSLTTHATLASSPEVKDRALVLAQAADKVGSPAIRNAGTIGGNLVNASPANDGCVALLSLGAQVKLVSEAGERLVPLTEFFVGPRQSVLKPGELLAEISIPLSGEPSASQFMKLGHRADATISTISAAVWLSLSGGDRIGDVRIAIGSAAPTPLRATRAEGALKGKKIELGVIERTAEIAAEETSPIDDGFGRAWYRKEMAKVLVGRGLVRSLAILGKSLA
ncbi:MAG: xanthine dehydrogenase family protein subunit M [Chloroflexi bacterium]|nr:xanthine dehydrogenase family protein subunit M [Chloroflexota bacterium]